MKIEKLALMHTLPTCLTSRVLGQCDALATIGTWGRSWLAGVLEKAPRVLLLGPTGVGKTECALALSEAMTGRAPARLDMSEFQLQESVGSLLGDRVGDTGRLSPLLVGSPLPLLLLDEIEKAHPRVLDLLLQMLEPGHLTLADGTPIDLTQVVIVCTSNLATAAVTDVHALSTQALEDYVLEQVRHELRLETLNRFDAIVVFRPLDLEVQEMVLQLHLEQYLHWLVTQGFHIQPTPEAARWLMLRAFDQRWGARPLRRAIRFHIGQAIVAALLRGESGSGRLGVEGQQFILRSTPA